MFKKSFDKVLRQVNGKDIVVVGAGKCGLELLAAMQDKNLIVKSIFDNNVKLEGLYVYSVIIERPHKIIDEDIRYVIAVSNPFDRRALYQQLLELEISKDNIIIYYPCRSLEYNEHLEKSEWKENITDMFREAVGYEMDWENPVTYNQKINWEKINLVDKRRIMLADKYKVRQWVLDKIGEEHIVKYLGVWKKTEDIDFEKLPESFVLKMNNGSGRNILVKSKAEMNIPDSISLLNYWLEHSHMYEGFETHYGEIEPVIVAEEYLEGMAETLYDYNIFCFHGEPKYIWCIKGSHRPGCSASFYDTEWNMQPFSFGYPLDIFPAPKPEKLNEMLELTRVLCSEFEHVRVDWYIMPDGRILFGEMTFQTWSGLKPFMPQKYDSYFGSLI